MGKKLGQHFLTNPSLAQAIVGALALGKDDAVLEVGPGEGILTAELIQQSRTFKAVELDPLLHTHLCQRFPQQSSDTFIKGDILKVDLSPQTLFANDAAYAMIGNLPYYLTTPFLFRMMTIRSHLTQLLLMVQQEVATRMLAKPADGKAYGSLSIACNYAFSIQGVRKVPADAFRPPPKVDSMVVSLTPKPAVFSPADELRFLQHIKLLFTARRKQLWPTLLRYYPALQSVIAAETYQRWQNTIHHIRAEALTLEIHLSLFQDLIMPLPVDAAISATSSPTSPAPTSLNTDNTDANA